MLILPIGASNLPKNFSFRNSETAVKTSQNIAQKAEAELNRLPKESHTAGSSSAWWRNGYKEAVAALKSLVTEEKQEAAEKPFTNDGNINFSYFRDTADDGLI